MDQLRATLGSLHWRELWARVGEATAHAFPPFPWDTRVSGGARWNHSNQEPS